MEEEKAGAPKHLSGEEAEKYCLTCKGLEECQYGEGGRGYQARQEQYNFGSDNLEYTVYSKCRHLVQYEGKARKERLFNESGLPAKQKALRIKDLEQSSKAKRQCGAIVVGKISGLKLKETQGAIAIGNEMIARGQEVKYVTASEIVTELRYDNPAYRERLGEYLGVEVLIIAGVGRERRSEYNEEQLSMVIERRQRGGRRTVVVEERQREGYENLQEELSKLEEVKE